MPMEKNNKHLDHLYCCNNSESFLSKTEKSCLHSILLSHLDLIQEQNFQIIAKDNTIQKLQKENDQLRQRIQRLLKKRNSKDENTDESEGLGAVKSKQSKKTVLHPVYSNDVETKKSKTSQNSSSNNNNNNSKSTSQSEESKSGMNFHNLMSLELTDTSDDDKKSGSDSKHASLNIKLSSKNLFMTTDTPYAINSWKTVVDEDEEMQKCTTNDINLEVPSWDEKPIPEFDSSSERNVFVEDVSDEVFQKRHLKYEIDERRRKKWDVQRIREQKNIERLKKRHLKEEYANEYLNNKAPKSINSFFPSAETVKYIQVADQIPVHAFGELIPKLNPKDFSYFENNVYNAHNPQLNYMANNELINSSLRFRTKFVYSTFPKRTNEQKKKV